jgi:cytochrome c553
MNKFLSSLSVLVVAGATVLSAHAVEIKGSAQDGATKNAMCIGCHGLIGYQATFPEIHKVPMISGQSAAYIVAALTAYQKGDRKHPTMRGIAESLSAQDMADLAAYYSANGMVEGAIVPKEAAKGSDKVMKLLGSGGAAASCAGCHGANFNTPVSGDIPKLSGQHSDYLFVALKAYKTTGNAKVGRSNPIMSGMVANLSNAELKELANYISRLPGELKTVPQNRFK